MNSRSVLAWLRRLHDARRFADDSSEQVLERYVGARDEAAFRELVARHGRHVYAVCRGELASPDLAEDAFQATFLALVRKAHQIRRAGAVAGWLDRTARRTARRLGATLARRADVEAGATPPPGSAAEVERRDVAEAVRRAVDELPERYRLPIVYRYLQELPPPEVARVLGLPEATVKTRLHRGLDLLRDKLGRGGLGLGAGAAAVEAVLAGVAEALPAGLAAATLRAALESPANRQGLWVLLAALLFGGRRAIVTVLLLAGGVVGTTAAVLLTPPRDGPLRLSTKLSGGGNRPGDDPMRRLTASLALAASTILVPPAKGQVLYTIRDLGSPGGISNLGEGSIGMGINASGQVTGSFFVGPLSINSHAFRTAPGGTLSDPGADLGALGGNSSGGRGINDAGQVTGSAYLDSNVTVPHAFRTTATGRVSDPGTDLGTLGGTTSAGRGINASGQVTGSSQIAGNAAFHAFRTTATGRVSDPGTDLGTLGGTRSDGAAINAAGQVTGASDIFPGNPNITHAFRTTATGRVSDPGTDLGTLGGTRSDGIAINALGVVVGFSEIVAGSQNTRAFIYDTRMRDLNDLIAPGSGWVLTQAWGINDAGWITGLGTINGQQHAFVLTPVPEPSSLVLTAAALANAGIAFLRWSRQAH